MPQDKEILYNIMKREIGNLMAGFPVLNMFSDTVSDYVIRYIDPYISAFMTNGKINTEQLTAFTKQEVNEKIEKFKKEYEESQI